MRHLFFNLLLFLSAISAAAQGLTIERCYELSEAHYPTAAERGLIARSAEYSLKNAVQGYLPSLSLSAKATYQSDVTSIPAAMAPQGYKGLTRDQYQITAEANQAIWDGGVVRAQKLGIKSGEIADQRNLDVELYALRERVAGLFFGILLLDAQIEQNTLYIAELERNVEKVRQYINSGVGTSTDLDAVQVEIYSAWQKMAELESTSKAYRSMLSAFTATKVETLKNPEAPTTIDTTINRPEVLYFNAERARVDAQRKSIIAQSMPRIGLFVQGAYGNPGLNMLDGGFTPYAIGGVKVTWNATSLYSQKNDLAKLEIKKSTIEAREQAFLFNTSLTVTEQNAAIEKAEKQMEQDSKIIAMRENIYRAALASLEGGTMSTLDMMREATALETARVAKLIHSIEFLQSHYMLKNTTNN